MTRNINAPQGPRRCQARIVNNNLVCSATECEAALGLPADRRRTLGESWLLQDADKLNPFDTEGTLRVTQRTCQRGLFK